MGETGAAAPDLSVVVTVVDSGRTLERCLEALAAQEGGPSIEVLVPFDHITPEVRAFQERFPQFTFMDMGTVFGGLQPRNPLEEHAFYDMRRTVALKAARGRLIGILEDRGVPAPGWCRTMISLHARHPHAVIGGAVRNGVDRAMNWAVFFCDFGRYQPPLHQEDAEYATDINISYKREPLMAVASVWQDGYLEMPVHWELRRRGYKLLLTDEPVTEQHREMGGFRAMLRERYHWARMYGRVRAKEIGTGERLKLTLAMPLLPFVLLARQYRQLSAKGFPMGTFFRAAPVTFLALTAWALGEQAGYLQAKR